jgi:hypothetical protein
MVALNPINISRQGDTVLQRGGELSVSSLCQLKKYLFCSAFCATVNGMKKNPTSIRLSDEGKRLLALMAEKLAVSQSAVLEIAIREKARREDVK